MCHTNSLTHWRIYVSITEAIIGSDKVVQTKARRRHAIIKTNSGLFLIGPLGTNFRENLKRNKEFFIQKNVIGNVVCKNGGHLCRPRCINHNTITSNMCFSAKNGMLVWHKEYEYFTFPYEFDEFLWWLFGKMTTLLRRLHPLPPYPPTQHPHPHPHPHTPTPHPHTPFLQVRTTKQRTKTSVETMLAASCHTYRIRCDTTVDFPYIEYIP